MGCRVGVAGFSTVMCMPHSLWRVNQTIIIDVLHDAEPDYYHRYSA